MRGGVRPNSGELSEGVGGARGRLYLFKLKLKFKYLFKFKLTLFNKTF